MPVTMPKRGTSLARRSRWLVVGVAVVVAGTACDDGPSDITMTVTIDGPADVEIPAGSQLEVSLVDISLADAPAAVLDETTEPITSIPVDVTLSYDAGEIDDHHMYAIQARVEDADGNLVLITDTAELVITNDGPTDHTTVTLVGLA